MLLPRITAFGALDETPLALAGALDLAARRARRPTPGATRPPGDGAGRPLRRPRFSADRAWPLAAELAALMDEAERAEIDLATILPGLAAEDYAEHWQMTLEFMTIVTQAWPAWLAEQGLMNPAARQVALLNAQGAAWRDQPTPHPHLGRRHHRRHPRRRPAAENRRRSARMAVSSFPVSTPKCPTRRGTPSMTPTPKPASAACWTAWTPAVATSPPSPTRQRPPTGPHGHAEPRPSPRPSPDCLARSHPFDPGRHQPPHPRRPAGRSRRHRPGPTPRFGNPQRPRRPRHTRPRARQPRHRRTRALRCHRR